MNEELKVLLMNLPNQPGCYLMQDKFQKIIYVGKAIDLKKRVNSYFTKVHNNKTQLLVSEIEMIKFIITSTEKESLILEINLIKKHRPKYNVMFMDDKFYPYIQITNEKHPRLKIVRHTKDKKAIHFGPYPNSSAARDTLRLINKIFPLRKCSKLPKKECLYYHLNQCIAPCIFEITSEDYVYMLKSIKKFLRGDTELVINELETKMLSASDNLEFEKALEYKKLIDSVRITTTRQIVFANDYKNRDYIGFYNNEDYVSIQILIVRNGSLIEREGKVFDYIDNIDDTIISYLMQYYEYNYIPDNIYLSDIFISKTFGDLLINKIIFPQKGHHKKMLELAIENAHNLLNQQYNLMYKSTTRINEALQQLADLINYKSIINRIEAFDNSTLQGTDSIGSMVVFENGLPNKNEYRKFKITTDSKDDYSFMKEVLYRRYYRVMVDDLIMPDLIIVDGGLGQMNIALDILKGFNLNCRVIGLVKDDKHRTSYILDDMLVKHKIDKKGELFFLLTRIQDETHRYAISYHRNLRSKSLFSSVIDRVNGIGEQRKKILLKEFKSFKNLNEASLSDLENVLPKSIALELFNILAEKNKE